LISTLLTTAFLMPSTAEKISLDAQGLPTAHHAELVEKLLASLAGDTNAMDCAHLARIRRRHAALKAGETQLVDGQEALRQARADLRA
jgi:CTP:molybdopterin cytidylyltransferase MocA